MQLNPETGEFWVTEQGPNGGDEINVLKPGANYGWPYVSHGRNYMGPRISENPWKEGTEQPAVVWVPSIAVAGGTFYMGDKFPGWRRNFFVGGLREGEIPRTGQIQRIEFNEKWEEVRREPMLRELHQRIRDVREGPDGYLYALTGEGCDYTPSKKRKDFPFRRVTCREPFCESSPSRRRRTRSVDQAGSVRGSLYGLDQSSFVTGRVTVFLPVRGDRHAGNRMPRLPSC